MLFNTQSWRSALSRLLTHQTPPREADIREGLARLLAYQGLRKSPQLSAVLTYVVDAQLSNRGDKIKAYTVAVDALGRRADFDPQRDPIVRVAAGRLRLAMAGYYDQSGASDPIRITIPTGRYVPVFSWVERARKP